MLVCGLGGVVKGVFKLNDSVVDSVCLVDDVYLRFNAFLNNVKTPLDRLNVEFKASVNDLKDAAIQDPQLSENVRNIGKAFQSVNDRAEYNKKSIENNNVLKQTCDDVWDSLTKECNDAKALIMQDANDIDGALIDVQVSIQSSVVDSSEGATEALSAGSTTIADTQVQLESLLNPRQNNLMSYSKILRQHRENTGYAVLGKLVLILLFGFFSIIGMRSKHTLFEAGDNKKLPDMEGDVRQLTCLGKCCACCGCCSWFCALTWGILHALIALLFLPIAAVGSDVCLVLPLLPQKMGTQLGSQVAQITDTCWNASSNLFTGLGLDKQIQLDGINFTEFKTQFGADGVVIDNTSVLNLRRTIESIDINCYNNIQKNMNVTLNAVDRISANITFAENAFNNNPSAELLSTTGEKLIDQVKCAIQDFIAGTNCYFISSTWEEAVQTICVDMIGSLSWIGTSELFLAGFVVPYSICMLYILQRNGGHGPVKNAYTWSDEDGEDSSEDEDSGDGGRDGGSGTTIQSRYRHRGRSSDMEDEKEDNPYWSGDGNEDQNDSAGEEEEELNGDEILNWTKN